VYKSIAKPPVVLVTCAADGGVTGETATLGIVKSSNATDKMLKTLMLETILSPSLFTNNRLE